MFYNLKHGIFAHPFEGVACISTVLSVYGGFKLLLYHPEVLDRAEFGILSLPKYLIWFWVVLGFIGAVVTFVGLTMSTWNEKGRTIETSGLWMMGSMWLTAGVASAGLDIGRWEEYVRFFAIAVGCALRLAILHDFHKIMHRRLKGVSLQ